MTPSLAFHCLSKSTYACVFVYVCLNVFVWVHVCVCVWHIYGLIIQLTASWTKLCMHVCSCACFYVYICLRLHAGMWSLHTCTPLISTNMPEKYAHVCVCVYLWIGTDIMFPTDISPEHTHAFTTCIYAYIFPCIFISVCICMYACIFLWIYSSTYIHTYIHTFIHTYIHTYTQTDTNHAWLRWTWAASGPWSYLRETRCTYQGVCVCLCVCVCVCMHIYKFF